MRWPGGQIHSLAALSTVAENPVPIKQEAGWTPGAIWMLWRIKKSIYLVGKGPTIHRTCSIQHSHYTDYTMLVFQMDVN